MNFSIPSNKIRSFVTNFLAVILITLLFTFVIKDIDIRSTLTSIQSNSALHFRDSGIEYFSSGELEVNAVLDYLKISSCQMLLELGEGTSSQVFFSIFIIVIFINIIVLAFRDKCVKRIRT